MKYNKDNWKGELEPFWPNDVIDKGLIACIVIGVFFAIAFFMPDLFLPPHEMPADSTNTPLAVKPEWYFLAAYQTLKLFPTKFFGGAAELMGMGVQVIAITGLFLLPFLDRGSEKRWKMRPMFQKGVIAGVLVFVGLTIWGHLS